MMLPLHYLFPLTHAPPISFSQKFKTIPIALAVPQADK